MGYWEPQVFGYVAVGTHLEYIELQHYEAEQKDQELRQSRELARRRSRHGSRF
jgi:hypothetical protein